ncbi:MAG: hypothetical protein H0V92_05410 [Pseudonocardiales bacterium]|nr:hypothetical protein [Pseudonocardiales bacterium]
MVEVLGIDVADDLLRRWAEWLAPPVQPFLSVELASPRPLPLELRDTFALYGDKGRHLLWLDEETFCALPRRRRAELVRDQVRQGRTAVPTVPAWKTIIGEEVRLQADGHRFVWWGSLLERAHVEVLASFVTNDRTPSRHREVPEGTWSAAVSILPGARRIAGTFPESSGPNCFGAVLTAAGAAEAASHWEVREPFDEWLAACARPGGKDTAPGTVLVWRSSDGLADRAAVTLGDGWGLHKPSQGWMSPSPLRPGRPGGPARSSAHAGAEGDGAGNIRLTVR